MSDNFLKLRNKSIQKIYDSYLYAMDQIMTFYLSCVVFDEHAVLTDVEDYSIRASYNFCDEFTTIKKVKDVKNLIEDNTFQQLYRKQTLVSQISILEYYFSKLVKILRVPKSELEKPAELSEYGMNFFSKNATLCRIHAIARVYKIDSVITKYQAFSALQGYINTRNMIVHNQGSFDKKYKGKAYVYWKKYFHGQKLMISENMIDDICFFLNDHVKVFTKEIDSALIP